MKTASKVFDLFGLISCSILALMALWHCVTDVPLPTYIMSLAAFWAFFLAAMQCRRELEKASK